MTNHVPDLQRCKRLKDLGVEFPDVKFIHVVRYPERYPEKSEVLLKKDHEYFYRIDFIPIIPAPLFSEMLSKFTSPNTFVKLVIQREQGFYNNSWQDVAQRCVQIISDPNALADLTAELAENGQLKGGESERA